MSIGFGGSARIVLQDENTVMYEYAPYNLNEPAYRNHDRIHDGIITVFKDALVEPDIHEKIKRMPGGKKKVTVKRVRREVDYAKLFSSGKIEVENSRFCWQIMSNGCGMTAMKLIFKIFDKYQKEGKLPEQVSYHV